MTRKAHLGYAHTGAQGFQVMGADLQVEVTRNICMLSDLEVTQGYMKKSDERFRKRSLMLIPGCDLVSSTRPCVQSRKAKGEKKRKSTAIR